MSETKFTIRGYVTKGIDLERIKAFLDYEIRSMVCRTKNDNTKELSVEIKIKEE